MSTEAIIRALRLLPHKTPGKRRLARALLKHRAGRGASHVTDRDGHKYEVPALWEPVAFDLAVDGVYEPATLKLIRSHLSRGGTFVDVGANIGAFLVPAAAIVGRDGRVLGAEASPSVFPFLARNTASIGPHVRVVERAICAANGPVSFYQAPADQFGMGSMAPQFHATPVTVTGQTLDDLLDEQQIRSVDVLKVDVEGYEAGVFEGAARLLSGPRPPLVVFEFCDWAEERAPGVQPGDSQRRLADLGYDIWRLEDFVAGGRPMPAVITQGFEMLVARLSARVSAGAVRQSRAPVR